MYFMWLSDDQQALWRTYLQMSSRLQAELNRQLQGSGLSLADYDVLVALSERPGCRMSVLGERLGWEQSRVSHQLARMRARGLVARTDSSDDRRAAAVALTAAGRRALRDAAPGHAELVRSTVFDAMTPAQARVVGKWMAGVLHRLA